MWNKSQSQYLILKPMVEIKLANFSDAYYEYNPYEHWEFYAPMLPVIIVIISIIISLIIAII